MKKGWKVTLGLAAMMLALTACQKDNSVSTETDSAKDIQTDQDGQTADGKTDGSAEHDTDIQVFIAASLDDVMSEIAMNYTATHPDVNITFNADSSGTLLQQIEEGFECDIFFSAAQKQMDTLESDGLIVDGTRADVVNNQVCVVTGKGSGTTVTGLADIGSASGIALADGSVPVGKYTRQALINMGILEGPDAASVTTAQVSAALGGVEISEQSNVSKVRIAVSEGACEVGTVYYSDTYGHEDELDILEKVSYELTGDVIYPVCMVKNDEADEAQTAAAKQFYEYILSDEAKAVFDTYLFDTNVARPVTGSVVTPLGETGQDEENGG